MYLLVNHASGYIEEKNKNNYLIFDDSVNENKALLKKHADVCNGIKNEIKTINGGKENDYCKDYMKTKLPNGHTTSNPHRFDVDIMLIRRRANFDEFPDHFHILFQCNFTDRKIHVVFTYFFRRNFADPKTTLFPRTFFDVILLVEKFTLFPRTFFDVISIAKKNHVVLRYFYWCNFTGRKIHVASMYFFGCNVDGRKIYVVSTYFFRCNFSGRNIHVAPTIERISMFLLIFSDVFVS